MRTRALAAAGCLTLMLSGCSMIPTMLGAAGGAGAAAPSTTGAPTASAPTTTDTPSAGTEAPTAEETPTSAAGEAGTAAAAPSTPVTHATPPEQAGYADILGPQGEPVPDPHYLLDTVAAHTRTAKSYRMGIQGAPGEPGTTGNVDLADPRRPKADIYWFDNANNDSAHIVLDGDTVYTLIKRSPVTYARTPLADMPEDVRALLAVYVDPMRGFGEGLKDPISIEFSSVDTNRTPPEHNFRLVRDDGRPAYEHKTFINFDVDADLRLRGITEYENDSYSGGVSFADIDKAQPVQIPPKRQIVDLPGGKWKDAIQA